VYADPGDRIYDRARGTIYYYGRFGGTRSGKIFKDARARFTKRRCSALKTINVYVGYDRRGKLKHF